MGYRENVLMNKSDGRKKVLFVCVGNACRSLMAEAIARLEAPDAIEAFSAGFMPVGFVPELTKQTLVKNGYWSEGLESKGISPAAWKRADVVINMSGRPIEEAFREHSKVVDWEIEDPFERGPGDYQRVFEKIRARVRELAEEYKREYAANRVAERRSRPLLHAKSPMSRVRQNLRIDLPNPNAPGTAASVQSDGPEGSQEVAARTSRGTWSEFAALLVLTVIFTFVLHGLAAHRAVQGAATTDTQLGTAASNAAAKPAPPSPSKTPTLGTSGSAPGKTEASPPVVDSPLPEKADDVLRDSSKGSSLAAAAQTAEKSSRSTLLKAARGNLRNKPDLGRPKKQTARLTASVNSRPLKKPKLEAAASPLPVPPSLEINTPQAPNLAPTPPANARSNELGDKTSASTLVKQPAQLTGEVSVLADPYPSLRADERASKKQKQGASIEFGHLFSRVVPIYPDEAKRQGIQGTVKLHAVVDRNGSVKSVQPVSGPSVLGAAVVNAVRRWQYTQTKLAGQPVETEVDITVVFRLSNPAAPKS